MSSQFTEQPSVWQARLPFFYGWVIVAVVFLRSFTSAGALWSLGVLSVPIHDELGWSRSVIFAGITLRTLGAALGGVFLGKYLDMKGGPRVLAFLSGVIAAAALMSVALVQEPWQFLLIFGVIGGLFGAGPAGPLMGAVVPKWFSRRRGRAVATATMGTGLAAFLLPSLVNLVSEGVGWRLTFVAMGGLVVMLAVLPSLLLKTQPEDIGLGPDGDAIEPASTGGAGPRRREEISFTAGQAFRTTTLWLLVAVAVFGSVSPTAYPANLVSAYVDRGFSTATAAAAFSAYGMLSFSSRFLWGYLADRLHIRRLLLIIAVYTGTVLPLFLILPGDSALISGAITGAGIGGWVGLNQLVWVTYFGRANLGSIIGKVRPFITLSGATGPLYVAALADVSGSYTASIAVMAISWWFCSLALLFLRPPKPPKRTQAEVEQAAGPVGS